MHLDDFPKRFRDKRSDKTDLVATWHGQEMLKGELTDTFAIIFRTRGCSWSYRSGCTMCGYHTDTNPRVEIGDLEDQLKEAISRYGGEDIVKIYTSGSFLDPNEVPTDLSTYILSSFDSKLTVVESRPEYVKPEVIDTMTDQVDQLEIAIGLESANDFVLEHCINKGFTFSDYKKAREIVFEANARLRTYLLLKPPFLTEQEAIDDLLYSIGSVSHPMNTISINPVNVQRYSPLELLWKRKLYRPAWLWSLLEVIHKADEEMVISRAGLGSFRGAHNCGECDSNIVEAINNFFKESSILEDISNCSCKDEWRAYKEFEPYMYFRGTPDILSDRYTGYF